MGRKTGEDMIEFYCCTRQGFIRLAVDTAVFNRGP